MRVGCTMGIPAGTRVRWASALPDRGRDRCCSKRLEKNELRGAQNSRSELRARNRQPRLTHSCLSACFGDNFSCIDVVCGMFAWDCLGWDGKNARPLRRAHTAREAVSGEQPRRLPSSHENASQAQCLTADAWICT